MATTAARDFGLQSFCLQSIKDHHKVAALTRQMGLNKIELFEGHANFEDVEAFKQVCEIYRAAGVQIVSLGVQNFKGDPVRERKWFQCAKIAGAKHISALFKVSTFQTAIPAAAKLCDEFGIRIGIHCHGGYMFCGSPDILQYLLQLGGPNFGVCIDTAWCMQIGPYHGNPIKWVRETFKGRVFAIHYKDFIFDRRANYSEVVVGTGNLDLPALVTALDETGFDGPAVVEYIADRDNPVPSLTECVNKMRSLIG